MPLIIKNLEGGHTHTNIHTNTHTDVRTGTISRNQVHAGLRPACALFKHCKQWRPNSVPNKQQFRRSEEKIELDMSTVKCYKCLQMGHIAKACLKRTAGSTRVIGTTSTSSDVISPQSDPWIRTLMKSTYTVSQQ